MPAYDATPNQFTDGHASAPYTTFTMRLRYLWDENRLQLPVAKTPAANRADVGSRPQASVVRTASPSSRAVIEWTATRQGSPPDLPHPEHPEQAFGWKLASTEILFEAPALQADGLTQEHKATGVYIYFLATPVWVISDNPGTGSTPYDDTPPGHVSVSQFKYGWM